MTRRLALVFALLPGFVACWSVPEVDRRVVKPWLTCSDCTDGELERVVSLGSRATRYLRAAIIDGPTSTDDSLLTRQVGEGVQRARRYRAERRIGVLITSQDSSTVVNRQVDDFRLRYRLRAAQALHEIDARADSAAIFALCSNAPPELVKRPEFRLHFRRFGICP